MQLPAVKNKDTAPNCLDFMWSLTSEMVSAKLPNLSSALVVIKCKDHHQTPQKAIGRI